MSTISESTDEGATTRSPGAVELRHGVFLPPIHPVDENPTLCLERDLELMELADRLDFREGWIGEHHSSGFEVISSPELFIAMAAGRTKHIRLGTGVISIPYHNPLMAANRIIQLDHMTRGRIMCGLGPGLLPSDALMLGINPDVQRDRLAEGIDVMIRLFEGKVVTEKTDWYTLEDARLHLLPYSQPYPEVAVASAITPSGGRLAGKYDLGMLCVAADVGEGFDALDVNWNIASEIAQEHGRTMDRNRLRLVVRMHLAETREQAFEDIRFGLKKYIDYAVNSGRGYQIPEDADVVDWFVEKRLAVIGTPDDMITRISELQEKQGDFGVVLIHAHNWANWEATKRSYELYARYVMPHFSGSNVGRQESYRWVGTRTPELNEMRLGAARKMFEKHHAERGTSPAGSPGDLSSPL
jgi:limonene 1,2-monooxygenase